MNYTQIKRLFQNNTEFVPITLAEAVVVNTSTIPGLTSMGITTLDKVLKNTLGLVGTNIENIGTLAGNMETLTGVVREINTQLQNKQDKLTSGIGIDIRVNDQGQTVISATHTLEIYKIVTAEQWTTLKLDPKEEYENVVYLVPQPQGTAVVGNMFKEFLCVKDGQNYKWEEFGTIQTDVDLSGYVTNETFTTFVQEFHTTGVTAENVTTSNNQQVIVSYTIPADLYDSAVNLDSQDQITDPNNQPSEPDNGE